MTEDPATRWVAVPPGRLEPDGRPRVFCLPHAGGDTGTYQTWADPLADTAQVLPVVLPGRGKRYGEPPLTGMPALAGALAQGLLPLADVPYCLFGHSLGAVVAFEAARELTLLGRPPSLLVASGSPPPAAAAAAGRDRHLLPDDQFLQAVLAIGGTTPETLEEPELLELVLPRLRADYAVAETYRFAGTGPALPCAVRTYHGARDDSVRPDAAAAGWGALSTAGPMPPRVFSGGHFYLAGNRQAVTAALRDDLALARTAGSGAARR
ncbi:thioesterase II family protein [Streptomyces sp. TS71-3]|uniref:thioesterase II family protein n=1 Tax=Streptomyces sp. TS71-3 TaxID=2733862 RepID=UPI001B03DC13|nr:thioesterase [Streptomyces sp. TS71-3]GHJ41604.1 thioesterase [Streptomyces sp. TS71-3]